MFDILRHRLYNQQIAHTEFTTPGELVAWFGAVQAQDYPAAKWALGLRLPNISEQDVEQSIADRTNIRTWPMRGTLHFVATPDVRWMLGLLTPRVIVGSAGRYRQLELDESVFARSKELLCKALQGGKQLSRDAMYRVLEAGHVSTAGQRGYHILGHLAQEQLLCFGTHDGKQPTFVLLDEWAPQTRKLAREEALAELALRYFTSHGPATVQDFVWWSGLTVADARAGLEQVKAQLVQETIAGKTYWMSPSTSTGRSSSSLALLLPNYDEYLVAYQDRSAALARLKAKKVNPTPFEVLGHTMVIAGQVVGNWKRTFEKNSIAMTLEPFIKLTSPETEAFAKAANRFGKFWGMTVRLT